jgi:hypothetical protein
MRCDQSIQRNALVPEETVRRFELCGRSHRARKTAIRSVLQRADETIEPRVQATVTQLNSSKLSTQIDIRRHDRLDHVVVIQASFAAEM